MNATKNFDAADLQYYFESQEQDTLDLQGRSRRATEILKIRDKLLSLPSKEFDIAVAGIQGFLNPQAKDVKDNGPKKKDAAELYDLAKADQAQRGPLKMGSI